MNTDIGGSYFKLVDDQSSTRTRPRHTPTLSNCTHTLSRIIHWGKWLPRQVYTYNTCTSCNQSSNMESELAMDSCFQGHQVFRYVLRFESFGWWLWKLFATYLREVFNSTCNSIFSCILPDWCPFFRCIIIVVYWCAWASTGALLFLQVLHTGIGFFDLLAAQWWHSHWHTSFHIHKESTVTCHPLFTQAQRPHPLICNLIGPIWMT